MILDPNNRRSSLRVDADGRLMVAGAGGGGGGGVSLGETSSTAYRGDRGKIAFDHAGVTGNPHGTSMADIAGLTAALAGKEASGTAATGDSAHVAAPDPHPQYAREDALAAVATSGSYADLSGRPGAQPFILQGSWIGTMTDGLTLQLFGPLPVEVTFASNFAGSLGACLTAATGSTQLLLRRRDGGSWVTVCTITISASGTSMAFSGSAYVAPVGTILGLFGPATADGTAADFTWAIAGTRAL